MQIYFTSDHHFGHNNIIRHCNRPFASVEQMDETLIAKWNARVRRGDTIYYLGDLIFRSNTNPQEYLRRLNGKIHLIRGNHDMDLVKKHPDRFASVNDQLLVRVDGKAIMLNHYAMRVWAGSHHGAWHLFGHTHGQLPDLGLSTDVGVDTHDFAPWSFEEVREYFLRKPDVVSGESDR